MGRCIYEGIYDPASPLADERGLRTDVLDVYLASLRDLGISLEKHDVRFVEDDWESPTLGAWGLGWEVWLDGQEITQFTYFQQTGGLDLLQQGGPRLLLHREGCSVSAKPMPGRTC